MVLELAPSEREAAAAVAQRNALASLAHSSGGGPKFSNLGFDIFCVCACSL